MATPSSLARPARELARLLVPVLCPGCGREDVRWCDDCAAPWWEEPWRCEDGAGRLSVFGRVPLPLWTLCALEGPAHHMVTAWKDGGRRDLDRFFADAARRAATAVAPALAPAAPIAVVWLPSRPRSVRRRGADLPRSLARAVAEALTDAGVAAELARALAIRSGESRGAGVRERWREAREAVSARPPAPARPVLLVDDVVTTGATIAAAVLALEAAGATVCAGLTLAARGN